MTVSSTVNKTQADGNGSTSAFPFSFKWTASSEIEVYVDDTLKTLSTHYTLSLPGDSGTVTFLTSPTDFRPQTGEVVTIRRIQPLTQTFDPTSGGGLSSSSVEGSDDNLLMKIQQIDEQSDRAPRLKVTTETGQLTFPEPVASAVIAYNAAGTDLETKGLADIGAITTPASSTDEAIVRFDGTSGLSFQNSGVTIDDNDFVAGAAGVGIGGATPDATNRLSVNTPAVLFNRETDDIQVKLNKAAAGDTASFLFQTGFSGRAEIGTTGDDDFHFKVSPDGSTFRDAITIDKDDGAVSLPQGILDLTEISEPSSPASNVARAFAVDDGNGTTELRMKDSAGAVSRLSHTIQTGTGAVTRAQYLKARDFVFVEDFGAVGDGTTNDLAAFQAAIDAHRLVFCKNLQYRVTGGLTLPNKQQIHGFGRSQSDTTTQSGAPILVFDGTADACFANANPAAFIGHGGFYNLVIRCTGTYDWIFDLVECIEFDWKNVAARATGNATGVLRSQKLSSSNPSWIQRVEGCQFHIPDASSAYVVDQDWSDSTFLNTHLTGGIGSIDRGFGIRYVACNLERSSGAGITIKKQTASKAAIIMGCFIDANADFGILIDVDNDSTSTAAQRYLQIIVQGNMFRTVDPNGGGAGTCDVGFTNNTGNLYRGVQLIGNSSHADGPSVLTNHNPAQFTDVVTLGNNLLTIPSTNPTRGLYGVWQNVDASGTDVSHTGNTTETALATISIPANSMGPNGKIRVRLRASMVDAGATDANKTLRVRLGGIGGTALGTQIWSASDNGAMDLEISNSNSVSVQEAQQFSNRNTDGIVAIASASATQNTATTLDLVISGQLATAADTITLASYTVDVMKAA